MPFPITRFVSRLFTAALLVLCVTAATFWVRTASTTSLIQYSPPGNDKGWSTYRLSSVAGRLGVFRTHGNTPGVRPASTDRWQFEEHPSPVPSVRPASTDRWQFEEHPSPVPSSRVLTWGYAKTVGKDDSRVQLAGFQYYETLPAGGGYASQQGG